MNDIEWVAESDWNKVKRGSIVQLRRGTSFVQAEWVAGDGDSMLLGFREDAANLMNRREYKFDGWSLFVEAPPAVVLPTEPGCYKDNSDELWLLLESGSWVFPNDANFNWQPARWAPFTRLEPVPETAKKVLDAVLQIACIDGDSKINLRAGVKDIAAEYGVTL